MLRRVATVVMSVLLAVVATAGPAAAASRQSTTFVTPFGDFHCC